MSKKEALKITLIISIPMLIMLLFAPTQAGQKYHPVTEYIRNSSCPCSPTTKHEFRGYKNSPMWFYCVYCLGWVENQHSNGLTVPMGVND